MGATSSENPLGLEKLINTTFTVVGKDKDRSEGNQNTATSIDTGKDEAKINSSLTNDQNELIVKCGRISGNEKGNENFRKNQKKKNVLSHPRRATKTTNSGPLRWVEHVGQEIQRSGIIGPSNDSFGLIIDDLELHSAIGSDLICIPSSRHVANPNPNITSSVPIAVHSRFEVLSSSAGDFEPLPCLTLVIHPPASDPSCIHGNPLVNTLGVNNQAAIPRSLPLSGISYGPSSSTSPLFSCHADKPLNPSPQHACPMQGIFI
ncbi:hypothetical protein NE237_009870 [Protea cynaroides]|uniref:Uncharacterized protein n=1 Tax=Protea cynaroides TaxID=273540 RepID=A0A9Q0R0P2_9MAGN|nr:hypothetical protein NE237_009870 [Protea cynaroides]